MYPVCEFICSGCLITWQDFIHDRKLHLQAATGFLLLLYIVPAPRDVPTVYRNVRVPR
jgi:hypothetical protein